MRLSVLFLVLLSACATPYATLVPAPMPAEHVAPSAVLARDVRYVVHLPPGYETSRRAYPVVYLLHAYGHYPEEWFGEGGAARTADSLAASDPTLAVILVALDGGTSFFGNSHDGALRYGDFFADELVPEVDRRFRTVPDRQYRALVGASMGGLGALVLGLHRPDLFSGVAAFSASVRTDSDVVEVPQGRWDGVFGPFYGSGLEGEGRLTSHLRRHAPLTLTDEADADALRSVRWWVDCGDDDPLLYRGNAALHVLLRDRDIPHEYRVRDGGHDWAYWRPGLGPALAFLARGMGPSE